MIKVGDTQQKNKDIRTYRRRMSRILTFWIPSLCTGGGILVGYICMHLVYVKEQQGMLVSLIGSERCKVVCAREGKERLLHSNDTSLNTNDFSFVKSVLSKSLAVSINSNCQGLVYIKRYRRNNIYETVTPIQLD
jgi:hypothetical protein